MSSSSSWRGPWNGESGARKSPIPYRIGPLAYEPAVFCHCGKKAALWISWSDDNPGRRYVKCFRARDGGCDFVTWYETPDEGRFVQTLLVDLRDAVWCLKRERAELRSALSDALVRLEEEKKELAELKEALKEGSTLKEESAMKMVTDGAQGRLQRVEKDTVMLLGVCGALALVVFFFGLG